VKRKIKYLGLFLLSLTLVSATCVFIFKDRLITHYRPEIRQVGIIHINIKNDTSYITSKLEISNRTFLKISVDTIKYKIDLFDKTYLQSTEGLGIKLPGNGKDTIDFSLKIPHVSLMRGIKAERKKGDSAGYEINIALQMSALSWKGEIPFNRTSKLKIPTPPELELVEIRYKKVRLRSIIADVKIKITNHSNVSLSVKDMIYRMNILKQGDVRGNYKGTIHISPNSATVIDLPINITIDHMGKVFWNVLRDKDNYAYSLSMNALIESISPISESFRVEVIKSGNMELKK
jgi:LEA14-like dessication related protein